MYCVGSHLQFETVSHQRNHKTTSGRIYCVGSHLQLVTVSHQRNHRLHQAECTVRDLIFNLRQSHIREITEYIRQNVLCGISPSTWDNLTSEKSQSTSGRMYCVVSYLQLETDSHQRNHRLHQAECTVWDLIFHLRQSHIREVTDYIRQNVLCGISSSTWDSLTSEKSHTTSDRMYCVGSHLQLETVSHQRNHRLQQAECTVWDLTFHLGQSHIREITDYIRQNVLCRISYFIQELFTNSCRGNQTSSRRRFSDNEISVRTTLYNWETYIRPANKQYTHILDFHLIRNLCAKFKQ